MHMPDFAVSKVRLRKNRSRFLEKTDFDSGLLVEDESYELIQLLGQFEDVIYLTADDYEPYHLAQYALELARVVASGLQKTTQ